MPEHPATSRAARWAPPAAACAAVVALAASALLAMGQPAWCKCGEATVVSWDTWSMHNSQHLLDAYALSHVLHGVLFFPIVAWALGPTRARWRLPAALLAEAAWEILENTPLIIERYRENTASLDYFGDSVANSLADVAACAAGFAIAASVPWWGSVLTFVAFELILLAWIRDSLVLNAIMLVWPIEAIKAWQLG